MATRYFEFVGDDAQRGVTSAKFWEVSVDDTDMTVRFGKIGADGQTTIKSFDSEAAAQAEAEKLIAAKAKKGYVEKS
jgi:predicted DNA-binding WGR domain protein